MGRSHPKHGHQAFHFSGEWARFDEDLYPTCDAIARIELETG
jgi:hypothetical protein